MKCELKYPKKKTQNALNQRTTLIQGAFYQ